jgi:type IV secretion system protein VirD4
LTLGGSLQAATQFFAHDMRFQAALGPHLHKVYPPWGIIEGELKWSSQLPDAVMRAGGVGISLAAVGMIALVVAKLVMSNTAKLNIYLHGSARWANRDDIAGAGLLPRRALQAQKRRHASATPLHRPSGGDLNWRRAQI